MKLGLVIYSNDAETVWNAFRLGVFPPKKRDTIRTFLLTKGVECEAINTEKFKMMEQMKSFLAARGKIRACGTCLKIRHSEGLDMCPISTMGDLYEIVHESDKFLTF